MVRLGFHAAPFLHSYSCIKLSTYKSLLMVIEHYSNLQYLFCRSNIFSSYLNIVEQHGAPNIRNKIVLGDWYTLKVVHIHSKYLTEAPAHVSNIQILREIKEDILSFKVAQMFINVRMVSWRWWSGRAVG